MQENTPFVSEQDTSKLKEEKKIGIKRGLRGERGLIPADFRREGEGRESGLKISAIGRRVPRSRFGGETFVGGKAGEMFGREGGGGDRHDSGAAKGFLEAALKFVTVDLAADLFGHKVSDFAKGADAKAVEFPRGFGFVIGSGLLEGDFNGFLEAFGQAARDLLEVVLHTKANGKAAKGFDVDLDASDQFVSGLFGKAIRERKAFFLGNEAVLHLLRQRLRPRGKRDFTKAGDRRFFADHGRTVRVHKATSFCGLAGKLQGWERSWGRGGLGCVLRDCTLSQLRAGL